MKILPLNKIDVSRYHSTHPGILWLVSHGYRFKFDGTRVFMVRNVGGRISLGED